MQILDGSKRGGVPPLGKKYFKNIFDFIFLIFSLGIFFRRGGAPPLFGIPKFCFCVVIFTLKISNF